MSDDVGSLQWMHLRVDSAMLSLMNVLRYESLTLIINAS